MAETYQGRPCKRGHVGLRYKSNAVCVDCQYTRNRQRDLEYERARSARRRAEHRERQRRWLATRSLPAPLMWVYEMWSADHRCLYVGKTNNLENRRKTHRGSPDSASGRAFTEHAYMVLNMAVDAEVAVIKARQPEYNKTHNWTVAA